MSGSGLDRDRLVVRPLSERASLLALWETLLDLDALPARWVEAGLSEPVVHWTAQRVREAPRVARR